jgi:predicted RecA/RadA family phage recombinase
MKNYVQRGDTLTLAAPYDLTSGDGALIGTIFGVASETVLSGASVDLVVEGVFALAKASGALTLGAHVYFDPLTKLATATSTSNVLIGVAVVAAGTSDATATVRLNGSF